MSNKNGLDSEEHLPARLAALTVPGGGLSVVGVSGSAAARLLELLFISRAGRLDHVAVGGVCFGSWWHQRSGRTEPAVLTRTAADGWEIHAHGGRAVAESIVSGLCAAGGVEVSRRDWLDNFDRSAGSSIQWRLIEAGGWQEAQILSRQLSGQFDTEMSSIGQIVETATRSTAAELRQAQDDLRRLKRAARIGQRLPTIWRVVLRGPVNVGKSSLVNALAGYARSLVSPLAGTTRDLLETRLVLDGWQIELIDTAGERQQQAPPRGGTEQSGIERGRIAATTADLVLELKPATELVKGPILRDADADQRLVVATKADLLTRVRADAILEDNSIMLTSAQTRMGIDRLAEAIIQRLVPEAAAGDLDQGVPVTAAQVQWVEQLQKRLDQFMPKN